MYSGSAKIAGYYWKGFESTLLYSRNKIITEDENNKLLHILSE